MKQKLLSKEASFATKLIHAGEPVQPVAGAIVMPIFQSSTYELADHEGYDDVRYLRLNNSPNHEVLNAKLAALEDAEDALVTSSGMSAITTAFLALFGAGDHVLFSDCLYGGTYAFLTQDLPRLGITHDFIDARRPETWKAKLRPQTRALYVESITNPLMQVGELEATVRFAREHGLWSMIDNTFTSPALFPAVARGFDVSLHSATKYLNGHSDIVAGAILGSRALLGRVRPVLNRLGGSLDPNSCFLLQRGLRTLALRMRAHNENALALAQFLEDHAAVAKVHYPGLPSSPDYARACRFFTGGAGGMLSFELRGDLTRVDAFIRRLRLPAHAVSLGGVESLVARPAVSSHASVPRAARLAMGVRDELVRVSAGIEGREDLIADFAQALAS